jgi:hypothetical protein
MSIPTNRLQSGFYGIAQLTNEEERASRNRARFALAMAILFWSALVVSLVLEVRGYL